MNLIRKILIPIVPIYFVVTWLRNKCYDFGIKTSVSFDVPIICVGNLSVGGTGKSPMIEYLIRLLSDDFRIATLSRGYKRQTKGFQLATESTTMKDLGDEPFQFYHKFGNAVKVAVDGDRVNGIEQILKGNEQIDAVLLDDAFQHRRVKAGMNILLTTYSNPFFDDIVLPTGNLREPRTGYKRADCIIVTKCPKDISETEKDHFRKRIAPKPSQNVYFSSIAYADTVTSLNEKKYLNTLKDFTLVTGIANATPLVAFLKHKNLRFEHLNFKDHHNFNAKDIAQLETKKQIVTTEKDFMRLKQYTSLKDKLFYLPIEVTIDNAQHFNTLIRDFIRSF